MTFEPWDLVKIGIPVIATWMLARGSKQGDELRNLYTAWAAACYEYLLNLKAAREKAEGMLAAHQGRIEESIRWLMADPRDWNATGLPRALRLWEQARFAISMTDTNADYRQAIEELTTKFQTKLSLHSPIQSIEAAAAELNEFTDKLRNRFKIRYWLDEITRD